MNIFVNRKILEHAIANMMSDAQRRAMFAKRNQPKTVTSPKAVAAPKPLLAPKRIPYGDDAIGGIRPKPAPPKYKPSKTGTMSPSISMRTSGPVSFKQYQQSISRVREILGLY